LAERHGMRANRARIPPSRRDGVERLGKRFDRWIAHENARFAVDDALEGTSLCEDDDGASAGLRFNRHHSEIFDTRHNHGAAALVEVADLLVVYPANEGRVGADEIGVSLQTCGFWASPYNRQRGLDSSAGADGGLDPLVGDQGGHDQITIFGA